MIRRWFLEHPRSVGETYGQHCAAALSFSLPLLGAGLACAVHAFLPFLFKTTASRAVVRLNERMVLYEPEVPVKGAGVDKSRPCVAWFCAYEGRSRAGITRPSGPPPKPDMFRRDDLFLYRLWPDPADFVRHIKSAANWGAAVVTPM
jgi:Family of unknown function (DUF6356)